VTESAHRQPNLLLVGYSDDDSLTRPKLAGEWQVSEKSVRDYQYDTEDALPFVMMGGRVNFIVKSARAYILRREQRRNQSRRER
jgi:hypothetical protein